MNPPVPDDSPGAFLIALRDAPLSLDEVWRHVAAPGCGGQAFFVGSVRPDATESGRVVALEYEAYEGAAQARMAEIAAEAVTKFGATHVAMLHRTGRLEPSEPAVIVAAGCPHRAEAFAACRYLIDEIKVRVPIWKKVWTGGEAGEVASWAGAEVVGQDGGAGGGV